MSVKQQETTLRRKIRRECMQKNHPLEEIYTAGSDSEADTVRWCPLCGNIVVDLDYDGRTNPGQVMSMRISGLCEEMAKEAKQAAVPA